MLASPGLYDYIISFLQQCQLVVRPKTQQIFVQIAYDYCCFMKLFFDKAFFALVLFQNDDKLSFLAKLLMSLEINIAVENDCDIISILFFLFR